MENSKIIDVDVNETTRHDKNKNIGKRNDAERVKAIIWQYFNHGTEKDTAVCKMCKTEQS